VNLLERFERAPFGPLVEHMAKVKECVLLVQPMFLCVRDRDHDRLKEITRQVFKVEHEADLIKVQIRDAIPRAFALPLYRGDLLAYLKLQDDMADSAEDIGVLLTLKKITLHEALVEDVLALVRQVLRVCDFLFSCTDKLSNFKEADFTGKKGREILELAGKAEHAEWEADKLEYALSQKLFSLEDEIKPTDIFLWSKVIQELGRLANHADKTAERLRRMITH
jgi:predicted phosphate transport protein (TIGR00153 family)